MSCPCLREVTGGKGLYSIGEYCFANNPKLQKVELTEGSLIKIWAHAF
jgi:hypothetical protein